MVRNLRSIAAAAVLTIAVAALPSAAEVESVTSTSAWLWTAEERIAKRTDASERTARQDRGRAHGKIPVGWTPIDGKTQAELFLPVELVTRLVLNTSGPADRRRERFRESISAHGWEYEDFWLVLDAAAAPYLSVMEQSRVSPTTQGAARVHLEVMACASAVELLEAAYRSFGRQEFDEFLYVEVAPAVYSVIADHADTPDALRKREKGCR